MMRVIATTLSTLALAAACSAETIDPVTRFASDEPSVDAGFDAQPPADATPPGPVKRTVSKRNPFGSSPNNLLVDGDFELSAAPEEHSGQYGWIGFLNSSQKNFKIETGGICRTGLRCALLEPEMYLLGRGAAAAGGAGHVASIFAKLPEGDACALVKAYLIGCDAASISRTLEPEAAPDGRGWCEYTVTAPPKDVSICMLIDGSALPAGHSALVDSATLLPDDGTSPASGKPWTPTPEEAHRLASIRDYLRRNRPFGRPPSPTSARERPSRIP